MLRSVCLLLLFIALPAFAAAPDLPDTPAAAVAREWIDAVNSGERARLQAFKERYRRKAPVEGLLELRANTGGFDVVRVERSEPSTIRLLVSEREGDGLARLEASIEPGKPESLKLGVELIERPADLAIPRLDAAGLAAALDRRIDAAVAADAFSGRVLVTRNGETLYERSAGLADRDAGTPVGADTQFRLGSMNKMFTAVAILQFVDAGKLTLDTRVGEILADYPNRDVATKVRIRHLLTHTGGTGDIFGPEFDQHRLNLKTHADYLRLYGKRGLDFEPGAEQRYSNYGFILLGAIIEKLSGTSYYDHVQAKVFGPAGMRDTASPLESEPMPKRAKGYLRDGDHWASNVDTLPWRGTAAGGGLSTSADLVRFATALMDGTLLSKRLFEQATAAQAPDGGYGYGFGVAGNGAQRRFGHGGGAPGMNGELMVVPASRTIVVALANLDPPAASRLAEYAIHRVPAAD
ncbi:MAG: beta-lactamase family protein [Xanthomonadales bacterium]|nr:beta-lactamase family protein [Xanthomonadales bacterium]